MKKSKLLILIISLVVSLSCKNESEAQPDFSCDKAAKITKQSFGDLGMIIEYSNGKISKVYRADGKGLTENYNYKSATEVEIKRIFSDGGVGNLFNATLNSMGYVTKFVQISDVAPYTIEYTYDAQGYPLTSKAVYPKEASSNSNSVYTYSNGNLTKKVTYQNGAVIYTEDYTYYEDKINKADLIGNGNTPDMYGKFSTNLLKTHKTTNADKTTELYEYTYDLNAAGFVKSLTEKYTDSKAKVTSQVNKYEYVCL